MRILIIGASGLVGSNCLRHFAAQGWTVAGTYFSFAQPGLHYFNTLRPDDPANFDAAAFRPDAIVHCGAMTHVDRCEQEPEESYTQTVESTRGVVALANRLGARLVYLSTDYVFDGHDGPYAEDAPVNPLSVYGKHKLEAEQMVLREAPNPLVLRVTNIYGHEARGKNFVARIIQQCAEGKRLTLRLPYDQYANPTNAADIATAMCLLLRDGKGGIYHVGSTDYMNRVELALRVLRYFPGAAYDLEPVSTEAMKQPAARPLRGGFVAAKLKAEYPELLLSNVDDFLRENVADALSA